MKSIDKLRKTLKDCTKEAGVEPNKFDTYWITARACDMLIDEIESEIAEKYIELPTCKDGVIKIGCDIGNECCHIGKIDTMLFDAEGAWEVLSNGNGWAVTGDEHYYVKTRTLEDVLEDYVVEYQTRRARSEFGAEHFDHVDVHEMVKRCADEIRELLGGDA